MDEKIPLTCPRCNTSWEKPLQSLERLNAIYRELNETPQVEKPGSKAGRIVQYRDQCPACGIYVVVTVEED